MYDTQGSQRDLAFDHPSRWNRPTEVLPASQLQPASAGEVGEGPWPSAWQGCLFALDDPAIDASFAGAARLDLDDDCWVDYVPHWLSGADLVFAELVARLDWQQRRVVMYDKLLAGPRLTAWYGPDRIDSPPLAVCSQIGEALRHRYAERFDSIGFNYYRDGNDSVAWHGDTVRRRLQQAVVAIVSVGAPRPFLLRPTGGGPSRGFAVGQGDLLVMGGACQRHWQHCVPKVKAAGPRISITYRHDDLFLAPRYGVAS
jgi:alkylated DNA repair dioxygenase AlkB